MDNFTRSRRGLQTGDDFQPAPPEQKQQQPLPSFEAPLPPRRSRRPASHHRTAPASRAAAESAWPREGTRAHNVLSYLSQIGRLGATRDELSVALGLPIQSVCGLVRRLMDEGKITEIDEHRPTRYGKQAAVLLHYFVASGRDTDGTIQEN